MEWTNVKIGDYVYNVSYDRVRKVKIVNIKVDKFEREYEKENIELFTVYLKTEDIKNTGYKVKYVISSEHNQNEWFTIKERATQQAQEYIDYHTKQIQKHQKNKKIIEEELKLI